MNIYFPKTGRSFSNHRSAINHARRNYSSMEEAYCDAYGINEPPLCPICNEKNIPFKSLRYGYKNKSCCSPECIKSVTLSTNKKIGRDKRENYKANRESGIRVIRNRDNLDLTDYILENLDMFRMIVRDDKPFCLIDYKLELTGIKTLSFYYDAQSMLLDRVCILSGVAYQYNCLYDDLICDFVYRDETIRERKTGATIEDIVNASLYFKKLKLMSDVEQVVAIYESGLNPILFRHCVGNDIVDYVRRYKTTLGIAFGEFVSTPKKTGRIRLDRHFDKSTLKMYHSDAYCDCINCGTEFKSKGIFLNLEDMSTYTGETEKALCSQKCYYDILSKDKSIIYVATDEVKEKQSKTMKRKIMDGEWTPCTTNSRCKSRVDTRDGKWHFRSTWEAVFYSLMKHHYNVSLDFETVRVQYTRPDTNKTHVYLVDFVDLDNKILYEVKPKSSIDDEIVVVKEKAATEWANNNGYSYVFIDDKWFTNEIKSEVTLDCVLNECKIDKTTLINRMKQFIGVSDD